MCVFLDSAPFSGSFAPGVGPRVSALSRGANLRFLFRTSSPPRRPPSPPCDQTGGSAVCFGKGRVAGGVRFFFSPSRAEGCRLCTDACCFFSRTCLSSYFFVTSTESPVTGSAQPLVCAASILVLRLCLLFVRDCCSTTTRLTAPRRLGFFHFLSGIVFHLSSLSSNPVPSQSLDAPVYQIGLPPQSSIIPFLPLSFPQTPFFFLRVFLNYMDRPVRDLCLRPFFGLVMAMRRVRRFSHHTSPGSGFPRHIGDTSFFHAFPRPPPPTSPRLWHKDVWMDH